MGLEMHLLRGPTSSTGSCHGPVLEAFALHIRSIFGQWIHLKYRARRLRRPVRRSPPTPPTRRNPERPPRPLPSRSCRAPRYQLIRDMPENQWLIYRNFLRRFLCCLFSWCTSLSLSLSRTINCSKIVDSTFFC